MSAGFATVTEEEGVRVTAADVEGCRVAELRFPPDHVQPPFEPELPYLAVVLEGLVVKSFPARAMRLARSGGVTMPASATHGARFGPQGARIAIVKPRDPAGSLAACLDRLVELRAGTTSWLAWRLVAELHAVDAAAPLATEGLALELLAATRRESGGLRAGGRAPAWLRQAEDLLRARTDDRLGLGELATEVGVHPTHLARTFRARHGVSIGEYGRRLRLGRAADELARTETPIAAIATRAGFSDQSHFTRVFRRYIGTTPARYRESTRSGRPVAPPR
jgi:AraC family transcriptional regulator